MKYLVLLFLASMTACATTTVCKGGDEGFRPVYDAKKNCAVRIRETVVGSSIDLPKSISFKESDKVWSYRWIEPQYKEGVLELGHFVLVPVGNEESK